MEMEEKDEKLENYVVEAREEEHTTWKVNRLQDERRMSPPESS